MCLKLMPQFRPPAPARREGGVRGEVGEGTGPGSGLSSVCSPSWTLDLPLQDRLPNPAPQQLSPLPSV